MLYHLDYVDSMTHCFYKAKLHGMVCVENILTCDIVGFGLAYRCETRSEERLTSVAGLQM